MIKTDYQKKWDTNKIVHGILCGLAILFFAISGALLRLIKWQYNVRLHYTIQLFALALLIAGMGIGVWLGNQDVWVSCSCSSCLPISLNCPNRVPLDGVQ